MSDETATPEENEPVAAADEVVAESATEGEAVEAVAVEVEAVEEAAVETAPEAEAAEVEAPEVETEKREKPAVPGADLVPDIVLEGETAIAAADEDVATYATDADESQPDAEAATDDAVEHKPIAGATIDLGKDARYHATGKRKSAIARVTLKPGTGEYLINGRAMNEMFPRLTLQRNMRQPLEAVGYESKMDVVALIHGGGVSAQADALRHGISRALVKADPNLRGELKKRGFLTRDPRVVERKKAGLKKARKRPQFSKR